ncbi:hypothetical protein LG329_11730 [Virgibacillus necropolis]|uniref:HAAS domain-containing protein n=1 Tax=Virgibacillus necropolis TaxID=163877 RepID=UPI00384DCFD2
MKNCEIILSKESRKFLDDLRLYLLSSGKKSGEVEEIVHELKVHLMESEKEGKPIEKIIGRTPKEYMEQLSDEMPNDYLSWIKYLPIIALGAFSFIIIGDAIRGELVYSMLQLVGYPVISLLFIFVLMYVFKYTAGNSLSKVKEIFIFLCIGMLPIALFVGLIVLDRTIDTPLVHLGSTGSIIVTSLAIITMILLSVWSKTWILIILSLIIFVPEIILNETAIQESTKSMLNLFIIIIGVGIYLLISSRLEKNKGRGSNI